MTKKFLKLFNKLPIIFWVAVFIVSLLGIFYLGLNPDLINSDLPYYLLFYNTSLSILALVYLSITIKKIKRDQRKSVIGSKFTWSFIKIIPILTLVPVLSFYMFSFQYTQDTMRNMDKISDFFNENIVKRVSSVQSNVNDYVEKIYLDVTSANFLAIDGYIKYQIEQEAEKIKENKSEKSLPDSDTKNEVKISLKPILDSLVNSSLACQLQLYDAKNNLIAMSKKAEECIAYKEVGEEIDSSQPYLYYTYKTEGDSVANYIQTVVSTRYFTRSPITNYLILSSVYRVGNDTNNALIQLDESLERFKSGNVFKFRYDNPILRKKFLVDFSTTVLLTVLAVLAIVIRMINKLMTPLHNLSNATKEISKGNYNVKIKTTSNDDDINLLIQHFNEMSSQIRLSREGLDTHNLYLETILKYSYGVLALDSNKKIQFINPISEQMFLLNSEVSLFGSSLKKLTQHNICLAPLVEIITKNISKNDWSEELKLSFPSQNKLILCQGSRLLANKKTLGYVIVFNDITELNRAQKKAAWGEVAMKMAHEVKNPLTPILLSADRLRNKFIDRLEGKDLDIMEKTTSTIIDQVASMSIMVDAFSEFANTPKVEKKLGDINIVINSSVSLYDADDTISINLDLSGDIPKIYLDVESIKRVLINLIKNSKEANDNNLVEINIKS